MRGFRFLEAVDPEVLRQVSGRARLPRVRGGAAWPPAAAGDSYDARGELEHVGVAASEAAVDDKAFG